MTDEKLLNELKDIAERQRAERQEGAGPQAIARNGEPAAREPGAPLTDEDKSRIVEMAWEDRTPFEAIEQSYGLNESQVIELMRREMKRSSFKMWRERVSGRKTKHAELRSPEVSRAYCPTQYKRS